MKEKCQAGRPTIQQRMEELEQSWEDAADPEKTKKLQAEFKYWRTGVPEVEQVPVIKKARLMFIDGCTYEQIFLATGLPYKNYWKKRKHWVHCRWIRDKKLIEEIRRKSIEHSATEIVEKGIHLCLSFLNSCINKNVPLTVKDFKLISDAIANMHRIKQLEAGEPTSIDSYKDMTPEEMRNFLIGAYREVYSKHKDFFLPLPEPSKTIDMPTLKEEDGEPIN